MTKRDIYLLGNACQEKAKINAHLGRPDLANECNGIPTRVKAFIEMTVNVRTAQRVYFRTRSAEALEEAKFLESQLDDLLLDYSKEHRQPEMFKG